MKLSMKLVLVLSALLLAFSSSTVSADSSQLSPQTKKRLCRERTGFGSRAACVKGCDQARQNWNRKTNYQRIADGEERESRCKMTCERECLL
jgi:hypothetical protein